MDSTQERSAPAATALPLAVDLDGTLIFTDALFEAIAAGLRRAPLRTLFWLLVLPFAIARAKFELQKDAEIDIDSLPVNQAVLDYVTAARAAGRHTALVSATNQSMCERIARRFDVFDQVIGSDSKVNNKGSKKAARLEREFPGGYEYIGDSPADMKIWSRARAASFVGGGEARAKAITAAGGKVAARFERPSGGLKAWRKALRLHQWAKNGLIFVAPLLSVTISDPNVVARCLIAFPLLGIMASGTYLLNDLLDLPADRRHHSKFKRPFASGRIKLWQGFVAAPLLILGGLVGGFLLSPLFALCQLAYLVTTLAYSFGAKRIPLFDAVILGFLFTLRLVMGGVLAGVMLTQWLIVFSMFLFFSLSMAKRHVEVIRKAAAGERRVAARGYKAEDAGLTLALGVATATASPVLLSLYLIDGAWRPELYAWPEFLWGAPAILSVWLMRVWLLANRSELDDDPVSFAVKDPLSLLLGGFLAVVFAVASMVPSPSTWAFFTALPA